MKLFFRPEALMCMDVLHQLQRVLSQSALLVPSRKQALDTLHRKGLLKALGASRNHQNEEVMMAGIKMALQNQNPESTIPSGGTKNAPTALTNDTNIKEMRIRVLGGSVH